MTKYILPLLLILSAPLLAEENTKIQHETLTERAGKGNAIAQYIVGLNYKYGLGTPKDADKSFELLSKSAAQGYGEAQAALANSYREGVGVEVDLKKSFEWFSKSAAQGSHFGRRGLGWAYFHGLGVRMDKKKSFDLWLKGAEGGDSQCQQYLAGSYYKGEGVEKNLVEAAIWNSTAMMGFLSEGQQGAARKRGVEISDLLAENQMNLVKARVQDIKVTKKEKVIGTYQFTNIDGRFQYRFLKNGAIMRFYEGKPVLPAVWEIKGGLIHALYENGTKNVFAVNKDKSLTLRTIYTPVPCKRLK